jgi:hypothetical protein
MLYIAEEEEKIRADLVDACEYTILSFTAPAPEI